MTGNRCVQNLTRCTVRNESAHFGLTWNSPCLFHFVGDNDSLAFLGTYNLSTHAFCVTPKRVFTQPPDCPQTTCSLLQSGARRKSVFPAVSFDFTLSLAFGVLKDAVHILLISQLSDLSLCIVYHLYRITEAQGLGSCAKWGKSQCLLLSITSSLIVCNSFNYFNECHTHFKPKDIHAEKQFISFLLFPRRRILKGLSYYRVHLVNPFFHDKITIISP